MIFKAWTIPEYSLFFSCYWSSYISWRFDFSLIFQCRGYKRFLRRSTLENSDYLKDDCLQINCTVGVVVSSIERPHSQTISVPESNIGAHFGALLENLEGSDVTFNVDGEKFQAHRLILAARSPMFRSEFLNTLEESKEEIFVKDLEPNVFKV